MATIYCFSATGNSLYVSKIIAERIDGKVSTMIKDTKICQDDVIGFVFPIFFLGLPKTVIDFIKKIEITNKNAYIFSIATYGDSIRGALGKVEELLEKKNCNLSYGNIVKCVENYLPMYSEINNTPELHAKVEKSLNTICNEIKNRETNTVNKYGIINRVAYLLYPANSKNCDKHFKIADTCIHCGICQNICPRKNIEVNNDKPIYKHNCELCLACLHSCPKQAIDWKNKTEGRERYLNPNITLNEIISLNSN